MINAHIPLMCFKNKPFNVYCNYESLPVVNVIDKEPVTVSGNNITLSTDKVVGDYSGAFNNSRLIAYFQNRTATADIVLESYFKLTTNDDSYQEIIQLFQNANGEETIAIRFGGSAFGNKLQCGDNIWTLSGLYSTNITKSSVLNQWHHVKLVRSIADGKGRLYFDGVQQQLYSHGSGMYINSFNWVDLMSLFSYCTIGNSHPIVNEPFKGLLDETKFTQGVL